MVDGERAFEMPGERGSEIEVVAGPLVAGGSSLCRAPDGSVVLVDGAVPGERVRVRLEGRRQRVLRGTVSEVLEASADRVAPPCPHVADGCGGCTWQYLAVAAQRRAKVGIVRDAYRRVGRRPDADAIVREGAGVPAAGYRTNVRVAPAPGGSWGFRPRRGHEVVPAPACVIADDRVREVLAGGLPAAPGRLAGELVVRVSRATGQRSCGSGWVEEEVAGVRLRVSAGSFFQSGPDAAEVLVASVAAALEGTGPPHLFVDLYGGVGLFAATVGGRFPHRLVVERNPSAAADARHNLAAAAGGADVIEADVERWRRPPGLGASVVVADPSRGGLGRRGVEAVRSCDPERVVLVSCDPAAAARDAHLLEESGFALREAVVHDLFPHTFHCDVVARFDRRA